jgi:hypothetical protein
MANGDSATGHDHSGDRARPRSPRASDQVAEPTVLGSDVPWPAQWEPVLGPGGEQLGDELVPIGAPEPAPGGESTDASERRRPRFRAARAGGDMRERRARPIPLPTRLGVVAAGLLGALLGLGGLVGMVWFSGDGAPGATQAESTAPASRVSAPLGSSVQDWVRESAALQRQVERSLKQQRTVARRNREASQRRQSARRQPVALTSAPLTRSVATPAPSSAATADPWPGVSAAEREFTPGPWNLD